MTIRIISLILVLAMFYQDIVWAGAVPDKLAPNSVFDKDPRRNHVAGQMLGACERSADSEAGAVHTHAATNYTAGVVEPEKTVESDAPPPVEQKEVKYKPVYAGMVDRYLKFIQPEKDRYIYRLTLFVVDIALLVIIGMSLQGFSNYMPDEISRGLLYLTINILYQYIAPLYLVFRHSYACFKYPVRKQHDRITRNRIIFFYSLFLSIDNWLKNTIPSLSHFVPAVKDFIICALIYIVYYFTRSNMAFSILAAFYAAMLGNAFLNIKDVIKGKAERIEYKASGRKVNWGGLLCVMFTAGLLLFFICYLYIVTLSDFFIGQFARYLGSHTFLDASMPGMSFWVNSRGPLSYFDFGADPYNTEEVGKLYDKGLLHTGHPNPRVDNAGMRMYSMGYVASPFIMLFMYPFSKLIPYLYLFNGFVIFSFIAMISVIVLYTWKLNKEKNNNSSPLLYIITAIYLFSVFYMPFHSSVFMMGQIEPLYFVPFALGLFLYAYHNKKKSNVILSAILISFAVWIKIFPAVFILYFVWKIIVARCHCKAIPSRITRLLRRPSTALGPPRNDREAQARSAKEKPMLFWLVLFTSIIGAGSLAVFGLDIFKAWIGSLDKLQSMYLPTFQNTSLLNYLRHACFWISGNIMFTPPAFIASYIYPALVLGVIVLILYSMRRKSAGNFMPEAGLLLSALPLIMPLWRSYYNVIMLIPFITAFFYAKDIKTTWKRRLVYGLLISAYILSNAYTGFAVIQTEAIYNFMWNPSGVEDVLAKNQFARVLLTKTEIEARIPSIMNCLFYFPGLLLLFIANLVVVWDRNKTPLLPAKDDKPQEDKISFAEFRKLFSEKTLSELMQQSEKMSIDDWDRLAGEAMKEFLETAARRDKGPDKEEFIAKLVAASQAHGDDVEKNFDELVKYLKEVTIVLLKGKVDCLSREFLMYQDIVIFYQMYKIKKFRDSHPVFSMEDAKEFQKLYTSFNEKNLDIGIIAAQETNVIFKKLIKTIHMIMLLASVAYVSLVAFGVIPLLDSILVSIAGVMFGFLVWINVTRFGINRLVKKETVIMHFEMEEGLKGIVDMGEDFIRKYLAFGAPRKDPLLLYKARRTAELLAFSGKKEGFFEIEPMNSDTVRFGEGVVNICYMSFPAGDGFRVIEEAERYEDVNFIIVPSLGWIVFKKKKGKWTAFAKRGYIIRKGKFTFAEFDKPLPIHYAANIIDGSLDEKFKRCNIPMSGSKSLSRVTGDKYETNFVLSVGGVHVPKSMAFRIEKTGEFRSKAEELAGKTDFNVCYFKQGEPDKGKIQAAIKDFIEGDKVTGEIVVKPNSGSCGRGVAFFGISDLDKAVEHIYSLISGGEEVAVQERIYSPLFVEDGKPQDWNLRVFVSRDEDDKFKMSDMVVRYDDDGAGAVNISRTAKVSTLEDIFDRLHLNGTTLEELRARIENTALMTAVFVEGKAGEGKGEGIHSDFMGLDIIISRDNLMPYVMEVNGLQAGGMGDLYNYLSGKSIADEEKLYKSVRDWVKTMIRRAREYKTGKVKKASHEVNVIYPKKAEIDGFMEKLRKNYTQEFLDTISNMLSAGEILAEVRIEDSEVKEVKVEANGALTERDIEFIRNELMKNVRGGASNIFKIRITARCDALGRIEFMPHVTQDELEISPLAFLRPALLQYAIRHEMEHALDTESRDEKESEKKARRHDREFFADLSFEEQMDILWLLSFRNPAGIRGYQERGYHEAGFKTDIFIDLFSVFANKYRIPLFHNYEFSLVFKAVGAYGNAYNMECERYKDRKVRDISIAGVMGLPSIILELPMEELAVLQEKAKDIEPAVFEKVIESHKDNFCELGFLFVFLAGVERDGYSELAVNIWRKIEEIREADDIRVGFFFTMAFRDKKLFSARDRIIKMLMEGCENKKWLSAVFVRYYKGDVRPKKMYYRQGLPVLWSNELDVFYRKRKSDDSYIVPSFVRDFIINHGSVYSRALIDDFAWVAGFVDFNDPKFDILDYGKYFWEKPDSGDLDKAFGLFLKYKGRYSYIPKEYIERMGRRYWQGGLRYGEQYEVFIRLIGNEPRRRAIRFLKKIIRGHKRIVSDERHSKDISDYEKKIALEIYAKRLGKKALPQLLEWAKMQEMESIMPDIIEQIACVLTYKEIVESLGSTELYDGEKPHSVYKVTISDTDQALRHLDVLWGISALNIMKGRKKSRNKQAFKDIRDALDELSVYMPMARKIKFHIIEAGEFVFRLSGNHIFVSEGALRIIRRRSSLVLALAHEIAHREVTLANDLKRIKANKDFEDDIKRNFLERFIKEVLIGKSMFVPQEEEAADRRAIEVTMRLGYEPRGAMRLLEDLRFLRELSCDTVSQIASLHPNNNSRIMNMRGEVLLYTSEFSAAKKDDGVLLFAVEEEGKIKTIEHAFSVIERRWHTAPVSAKEPAIADWMNYIREHVFKSGYPVKELVRLQNHYKGFRPLWLNEGEQIMDFMPFEIIDEAVIKDKDYSGIKGLGMVYRELDMISPPNNLITISRTSHVLYHLSRQRNHETSLQDWLEILRPLNDKILKQYENGINDVILQYAHAMLSAFIYGMELAGKEAVIASSSRSERDERGNLVGEIASSGIGRPRNDVQFGRSFSGDLSIIRQLAGLGAGDERMFNIFWTVTGDRTEIKGTFRYYYDEAIKESLRRHNVSLNNSENEDDVKLALAYCLNPGDIINCLYEISVKGEEDVIKKIETFFKLPDMITKKIEDYSSNKQIYIRTSVYFHESIEAEARRLCKEAVDKGIMNYEMKRRFEKYFGSDARYFLHTGGYCEKVKAEILEKIKGIEDKEELYKIFTEVTQKSYRVLLMFTPGRNDNRYDLNEYIMVVEWFLREKLGYDVPKTFLILKNLAEQIAKIKLNVKDKMIDEEKREYMRLIIENFFKAVIAEIQKNPEDTFDYCWFEDIYEKILYMADVSVGADNWIRSIEGKGFEDTLSMLSSFPEIELKDYWWHEQRFAEWRSKTYYKYPLIQLAAYKKKKRLYERKFGRPGFEEELRLIVQNIKKSKERDDYLNHLLKRWLHQLDAEQIANAIGYFSDYGNRYKVIFAKEAVRKMFDEEPGEKSAEKAINFILDNFNERSKYRDELIDYVLSLAVFSNDDLLRYESLKSRFGGEALSEGKGNLFIKNLEFISQLEPDKKLEFLLWIKGIGQKPSYFSIEGRSEIASSKRMGYEMRAEFLKMPEGKLDNQDRFNSEFEKLHEKDRKKFFIEILGRPDGILSDEKVKKQFIEEEIWRLFETVEKDSPEGMLITMYLEEADPLTSAEVLAEILDISFKGLNNYERLALLLQTIGFIGDKTAQWFSVRLESNEARTAFRDAQRRPRPFTKLEAIQILEEEWGKSIDSVLKDGLGKELGFGSSKGVWEAELMDGRKVAVSVQRPNFEREMNYQFSLFNKVLERFKKTKYGEQYRGLISETMDVNHAMLEGEMDLRNEVKVRNGLVQGIKDIHMPAVLEHLTTQRVVVTDLVCSSVKLNDVEDAELKKIAVKKVIKEEIHQLIQYGRFHADPWPSNILIDKGKNVYFIDFAVGGNIPEGYLDSFVELIMCLGSGYTGLAGKYLNALTESISGGEEISAEDVEAFLKSTDGLTNFVDFWVKLLEFLYAHDRRFKGEIRVEMAKLLRTLGILEGLANSCDIKWYIIERLFTELVIHEKVKKPAGIFMDTLRRVPVIEKGKKVILAFDTNIGNIHKLHKNELFKQLKDVSDILGEVEFLYGRRETLEGLIEGVKQKYEGMEIKVIIVAKETKEGGEKYKWPYNVLYVNDSNLQGHEDYVPIFDLLSFALNLYVEGGNDYLEMVYRRMTEEELTTDCVIRLKDGMAITLPKAEKLPEDFYKEAVEALRSA